MGLAQGMFLRPLVIDPWTAPIGRESSRDPRSRSLVRPDDSPQVELGQTSWKTFWRRPQFRQKQLVKNSLRLANKWANLPTKFWSVVQDFGYLLYQGSTDHSHIPSLKTQDHRIPEATALGD